jgi:type II secretory pathway component GspD/PulD (secretin)
MRRKIVFHEPTGLLTITDTPTNHKQIEELLRYYDVPPTQVAIEARFIEIEATDMEEFGAELLTSYSKTQGGTSYLIGSGSSSSPGSETEPAYTGTDFGMSAGGFGNPAEGTGLRLLLGKTMLSGNELQALLMVLEQTDKATLLSAPKVTTLAGQPANIQVVQRIPYAEDVTQNITDLDGDGINEPEELIEIYDVTEQITLNTFQVTPTV